MIFNQKNHLHLIVMKDKLHALRQQKNFQSKLLIILMLIIRVMELQIIKKYQLFQN